MNKCAKSSQIVAFTTVLDTEMANSGLETMSIPVKMRHCHFRVKVVQSNQIHTFHEIAVQSR